MNDTRATNDQLKVEVLTHYGNGFLQCIQCGEGNINCLTLDHINNDGYKDKHTPHRSGNALYRKLKTEGYPIGYQTLCMNCNINKTIMLKREKPPTSILSIRVPGELYFEIMKRADLKKTTITDYVRNAVIRYMGYREDKHKGGLDDHKPSH